MDWTEMMPELLQTMQGDQAGNRISIYILYMVIGFGLFSYRADDADRKTNTNSASWYPSAQARNNCHVWYF